jgi:ABC-type Zn2+ transport system substrate-binding protein/surface adhesin
LTGLPAGATYSYNSSTGVVTFTGMPATLASGSSVGPITVSYTQPADGNFHGHGHDQRHDLGSESGQQHRDRHHHGRPQWQIWRAP